MSSKQTLEIRLADLRKKLAALSAKESLTEDEQQEVDKLASEYQETESRHKAAIIAEAEQHEQRHAGQEPDRETGEGAEVRRLMQRATIGGYVQAALQNSIGGGAEKELADALEVRSGPRLHRWRGGALGTAAATGEPRRHDYDPERRTGAPGTHH